MAPNRRPHKKSRQGCAECKRRHVKCDETRPTCVNCSIGGLRCSFRDQAPLPEALGPRSKAASQPAIPPKALTVAPSVQDCVPVAPVDQFQVNAHHMDLFSHFLLETCNSFGSDTTNVATFSRIIMRFAITTPYLMHESLALGALHLSHMRPNQRQYYRDEATRLQTYALSLFKCADSDITTDTSVPIFLFSSILGVHVLADVATTPGVNTECFLERFIFSMQIRRGIRAITRRSWDLLLESELQPILQAYQPSIQGRSIGSECDGLRELLRSTAVDASVLGTCQNAIDHLQRAFDENQFDAEHNVKTGVVLVWPAYVSEEYVDLLLARRPEALAILAYYGILLHSRRDQWFTCDSGEMLIRSVAAELGSAWDHWLAYPKSVITSNSANTSQPR